MLLIQNPQSHLTELTSTTLLKPSHNSKPQYLNTVPDPCFLLQSSTRSLEVLLKCIKHRSTVKLTSNNMVLLQNGTRNTGKHTANQYRTLKVLEVLLNSSRSPAVLLESTRDTAVLLASARHRLTTSVPPPPTVFTFQKQ